MGPTFWHFALLLFASSRKRGSARNSWRERLVHGCYGATGDYFVSSAPFSTVVFFRRTSPLVEAQDREHLTLVPSWRGRPFSRCVLTPTWLPVLQGTLWSRCDDAGLPCPPSPDISLLLVLVRHVIHSDVHSCLKPPALFIKVA